MIKIIIADDHKIFIQGVKALLNLFGKYEVIAEAHNGAELLEILEEKIPDIIILDLGMPIMRGDEAAEVIKKKYPSVKILVLSMIGNEESLNKMIRIGVEGYVLKESSGSELEIALDEIYINQSYFSQILLKNIAFKPIEQSSKKTKAKELLSKREIEIIKLICLGLSNIDIGKELFIAPRTVEVHKAHIIEKLRCKNTINMILYAIKNHLVDIKAL